MKGVPASMISVCDRKLLGDKLPRLLLVIEPVRLREEPSHVIPKVYVSTEVTLLQSPVQQRISTEIAAVPPSLNGLRVFNRVRLK